MRGAIQTWFGMSKGTEVAALDDVGGIRGASAAAESTTITTIECEHGFVKRGGLEATLGIRQERLRHPNSPQPESWISLAPETPSRFKGYSFMHAALLRSPPATPGRPIPALLHPHDVKRETIPLLSAAEPLALAATTKSS